MQVWSSWNLGGILTHPVKQSRQRYRAQGGRLRSFANTIRSLPAKDGQADSMRWTSSRRVARIRHDCSVSRLLVDRVSEENTSLVLHLPTHGVMRFTLVESNRVPVEFQIGSAPSGR